MKRKDYVTFARMLDNACIAARKRHYAETECDERDAALLALRDLAVDIAGIFANENPRFDRQRFYQACADANPVLRYQGE